MPRKPTGGELRDRTLSVKLRQSEIEDLANARAMLEARSDAETIVQMTDVIDAIGPQACGVLASLAKVWKVSMPELIAMGAISFVAERAAQEAVYKRGVERPPEMYSIEDGLMMGDELLDHLVTRKRDALWDRHDEVIRKRIERGIPVSDEDRARVEKQDQRAAARHTEVMENYLKQTAAKNVESGFVNDEMLQDA